jgi:hypothetical protein
MRRLTATRKQSLPLNSESLTYWYFRLNGFFTIPNFVVHPDRGSKQRTEVDVFGIRLPNRHELLANPMEDDGVLWRAVKLGGSRRPVGEVGETHGVFRGLSIGDRAGAVRRGSAQPTVHKFTAPARHGVRRRRYARVC